MGGSGGSIAQWFAILASGSSCLGSIFKIPEFFSVEKINDVAQVNQRRWLEESGQWLENFDRTHLVLASSLVLAT